MTNCIELVRGGTALVDDDDREFINGFKWYPHTGGYAIAYKNNLYIYMHRLILNSEKGVLVDHINKNKLDNRRSNLRPVTRSQNLFNSSGQKHRKSKYKGVFYAKQNRKWCAQISYYKSKRKGLGYFLTEEAAALAYNDAAKKYFGEYAQLNVIKKELAKVGQK